MSVTELQVIHRLEVGAKELGTDGSSSSGRRFLLNDFDQDDNGLVMKIDSKLNSGSNSTGNKLMDGKTILRGSTSTTASSPSAVRPSAVSSQLCGQGHEVTGWVLRGALFLQTAHIPFIKLTHKLNNTVQSQAKLLMPLVFYTSLLVLVAQLGAVVTLFAQTFMPLGMWFLLGCIAILAAMFCYTAILGNPHNQPQSTHKTPLSSGRKLL